MRPWWTLKHWALVLLTQIVVNVYLQAAALVRISAQLVAVARTLLPELLLELDKLLIFVLAADRLALLAARVLALRDPDLG